MDPRWANSHMFYISFASGSELFTRWLREILLDVAGIRGHISRTKNFFQLRYAKTESLVLITKMYYNLHVPCLQRKRRKILNILKVHRKIQSVNSRIFLKKTPKIKCNADVVELVYTCVRGAHAERREGSNPSVRTRIEQGGG